MIKYLLDTNIISELPRHSPDKSVIEWASTLKRCALSAVTVEELYFGLSWHPNIKITEWIEKFIDEFCEVLPVSKPVSRRAGILRGQFQSTGVTRSRADMLIAATAAEHGLVLVTHKLKDYEGCGISLLDPFTEV